ncbi:MAG: 16S rRNA (guanine(527)-N(7))-methyltransferase RsmG [Elusimicrobiota bacterium]
METFLEEFNSIIPVLKDWGISLPEGIEEKLAVYCRELASYNEKVNLVADASAEEIVWRHFLDSLACLLGMENYGQNSFDFKLIDIGSGAGFPGLVLKIARPQLKLTLLEATGKKCEFLNHLVQTLNLSGVEVIWGRAETFAQNPDYREKFFLATSRALANLASLYELCLPFLEVGGIFLAQKGRELEKEIKEAGNSLKILGGNLEKISPYTIKDRDFNLAIIKKISSTPPKYPRRDGLPQKKPLK